MDSVVAILKDSKVVIALNFSHDPSADEINQFVELHEGTSGRKLTEYEIVNSDGEIEERVRPYPSWTWDSVNKQWLPPVTPPPIDEEAGIAYTIWDEDTQTWQAGPPRA
jgi:hypothetical protein